MLQGLEGSWQQTFTVSMFCWYASKRRVCRLLHEKLLWLPCQRRRFKLILVWKHCFREWFVT